MAQAAPEMREETCTRLPPRPPATITAKNLRNGTRGSNTYPRATENASYREKRKGAANRRSPLLLLDMPDIELSDSSVIRLRPCTFVQEMPDRFGIIRRRGTGRVVVRKSGLEFSRLFRAGCTIGEAKRRVAGQFKIANDAIDLQPLLRSLLRADLIASVDGNPIKEAHGPSLRSAYHYYLRFHVTPRVKEFAYRRLPVAAAKRLAYWVQRLDSRSALWPRAIAAEERYKECPRDARHTVRPGRFAARYFGHQVSNIVDFQVLLSKPPAEAEEWFRKHVQCEGLENLKRLTDEGTPAILAGFHFSATKLIPLLLMRRGFDICQMWVPDGSTDLEEGIRWLDGYRKVEPGFGGFSLIPDFTLPSYRRLIQALRTKQVLVWFPDLFGDQEALDDRQKSRRAEMARVFGIGELRMDFAQSKLAVPLCGQKAYVNAWLGAFARLAGAAVVPAALVRQGSGMRLLVKPPLRLPAGATAADAEALNRALFAQLDSLLRLYPEQWFGWHRLCLAS